MNKDSIIWIDARDNPALLLAMMKEFVNRSNISFEGTLSELAFLSWPTASVKETPVLKRHTILPRLEFVVIPLNDATVKNIWNEIAVKDHLVHEGIIHVQIECAGKLVFGGYDNFHRECTVAYPGVPETLLEELRTKGVIRGFQRGNA